MQIKQSRFKSRLNKGKHGNIHLTYNILIRKQKNEGVALLVKRVQIYFTYLILAVLLITFGNLISSALF